MQASNQHPGPSSMSQEPHLACQRQMIENILRNIDKPHLLTKFPSSQDFVWDDTLIPYRKHQLHEDKSDYRDRFLEEQKEHLTDTSQQTHVVLESANRGAPPHLRILDIGKIFDIGRKLGEGTFGTVFEAKLSPRDSGNVDAPSGTFAIKRFRKLLQGKAVENTLRSFKTERDNLERSEKQKHPHLVSFHASFTDEEYFGFITSPVAESNLKNLLERPNKDNVILEEERESLSQAFGCLLEAVRHLHEDLKMRHCDLKPSNILVCGRPGSRFSVKICDLGISYAWNLYQDDSTNKNQRGTQRYKAPELSSAQDTSHNRMVDIFSLGCIFLEMFTRLRGRTLDEMARAITKDRESSFDRHWAYADSLIGVKEWLRELQTDVQDVPGKDPVSLITHMLHEDRKDRKEAGELLRMIHSDQYVDDCCRGKLVLASPKTEESQLSKPATNQQWSESSERDDDPMEYETSRPFKKCTFKSRKPRGGSNQHSDSEYECLQDFPQGGKVQINKSAGDKAWAKAWAMTREVKAVSHEAEKCHQWLPGYYVQARQEGTQVSFKWSDCDQLNRKEGDRQKARRFEKVHRKGPNRSNLLMEIDFCNSSDAHKFCQLLLEDPFKPEAPVEMRTPDQTSHVIHKCKWKYANEDPVANGGHGSLVVCSQHSERPPLYPWLEPFFVPYHFDFTIHLQNDQRRAQLLSKHLWVPVYRSNVKDKYEEPKDRGDFVKVDLVRLRDEYTFDFATASETNFMPPSCHHEPTSGNNRSCRLQLFLKSLTGWNLLTVFFATKVLQHHGLTNHTLRSCDVLCFQKGEEKRIAIRKEHGDDKSRIEWTTAKLVDPQVTTKTETLEAQLSSIERGSFLTLTSMTAAAGGARNSSTKSGKWSFTVKDGAAQIHHALIRP